MDKYLRDFFSLPPGVPPTTTMRMFYGAYQSAKMIEAAERGQTGFVQKVCCPGSPKCRYCHNHASSAVKPLVCSGCRAIIYCSRKCQVADWKSERRPHKLWCARDKEYMERHPYFTAQLNQFSWARIEPDGSFSHRIFEARLGVYGPGMKFGFWSVPCAPELHDKEELPHPKHYIHGEMMLQQQWPTDIDAWKLGHMNGKGDIIPRLSFTTGEFPPPPPKVEPGQIKDWESWYKWRGLSMASPAALLMHYPLSVYHILVDVLQMANCTHISDERQALQIHYIGAEKELNHLPLFSELALLLPCVDITLIVFGKPAFELVKRAHKSHQGSLATKDIVWSYTAPPATGGGSIEIKLYSKAEYWTSDVLSELNPDVLIGLNAGMTTYEMWVDPIRASLYYGIPFVTTDYDEENSAFVAQEMVAVAADAFAAVTASEGRRVVVPRTYLITLNPFHMPGQTQIGSLRLPSLSNGFVLAMLERKTGVYKRPSS